MSFSLSPENIPATDRAFDLDNRPPSAIKPKSSQVARFSSTDPTIDVIVQTANVVPKATRSRPSARITDQPAAATTAEKIAVPSRPPVTKTAMTVLCAVSPEANPEAAVNVPAPEPHQGD